MKLQIMSDDLADYLNLQNPVIDTGHPLVRAKIAEIVSKTHSDEEEIEAAFNFVRDDIHHNFDTGEQVVTVKASDALQHKAGICFAKSHLLAALLRGMGIPTGFCYQRVVKKGTPESGFTLHGLNAVYLRREKRWIRLDPRGDKPGVHSEFNTEKEVLAYPIRTEWGEIDYPYVYPNPLPEVVEAMENSASCTVLFDARPDKIAGKS